MNRPLYILAAFLTCVFFSCKKDSFIEGSGAVIGVSADSLHFDTLLTGTGSVTQAFKLFNRNNQKLRISEISLGGGSNSYFRINADGFEGPDVKDIEMAANDSLYVFVTVKIDPSSPGLPFIVQDSVSIGFNGNHQAVQLDAWGQNANFLRSKVISENTVWTSDRPYVILDSLRIDENVSLTIPKGTKIYLHNNAPILVDGTLIANGEKDSMQISFTGDRLDDPYNTYPGSWPGIYFRQRSHGNTLRHVTVRNASDGIIVQEPSPDGNPKLLLDKCVIDNCYDAGLSGNHTSIDAVNCLIMNCGQNVDLEAGGNYSLTQCTVVSYSNVLVAHKSPVLNVNNFAEQDNGAVSYGLNARFTNCIFWGENGIVDNEVETQQQGGGAFNVSFTNCLWKVTADPAGVTSSGNINAEPMFRNIDTRNNVYDLHLTENSPALNAGSAAGVATDLDETPRDPNFPDIGAYEATF